VVNAIRHILHHPSKKGWKTTKKATCVYEGENVPMKGKSTGF